MAYQIPSLPSLSSSTLPCSSKTWPRSAAGSAALVQGGFVGKLVHDAFSRFLAYNHARQHLESYGLTSSSSSPCQAPSSSAPAQDCGMLESLIIWRFGGFWHPISLFYTIMVPNTSACERNLPQHQPQHYLAALPLLRVGLLADSALASFSLWMSSSVRLSWPDNKIIWLLC